MSQGSRVLQSVEGEDSDWQERLCPLWNAKHAGGSCASALLSLARRCSCQDGPFAGSQAGDLQAEQVKSKGSKILKRTKNKHEDAQFYFLNTIYRLPCRLFRKFSVLTISNMNASIFEVYFALSSVSCVTCPPCPHQKTDLLKQQIGESR